MKRHLLPLLLLGCVWSSSILTAAEKTSPARFDDPAVLLPKDSSWVSAWEAKLADFERTTGLKIFVQYHPKSPPEKEDKVPGAYMHALAEKLGTVKRGALVVYFADEDDWRVWIGDETTPIFVGQPGTAKAFTKSGKMHEVKEAFLKKAHEKGEAAFAAVRSAPGDKEVSPVLDKPLRLKFLTEALLGDLMVKLGPK